MAPAAGSADPVALLAELSRRLARPWSFHYENALGTSLALRFLARSAACAEKAEQAALAELKRLEAIFSSFDPASELCTWRGTQRLSPELAELLRDAEHWGERSGGAFHPGVTLGRERLWRDEGGGEFTRLTEAPFTLNAIAKGEIVDRMCRATLQPEQGVYGVVVNCGGDLCVHGAEGAWARVQPDADNAEPLARVWLKNQALATSGLSRRGNHLYDPRTGQPVTHVQSASVIAPTARRADVLATVCCVLTLEETLGLVENEPEIACLLVRDSGEVVRSRHWADYEEKR